MKVFFFFILGLFITMLFTGCAGPLHTAAEKNDVDEINRLLDQGADIHEISMSATPLENAAAHGSNDAIVFLISKGAKVTNKSLYYTSVHGHSDTAILLIQNGADLTFVFQGKNALAIAQEMKHIDTYNAIIQAFQEKEQAKRDAQAAVLAEQKAQAVLRQTATIDSYITKNDMNGLKEFLDLYPEALATIKNMRIRLLMTGPSELRIIDILNQIKNKKNESIIISRIKGTSGAYKNFNDSELNELSKMGISDEIAASMITVTNEYYKEQKRLAQQQALIAAQQKAAEEQARLAQQKQQEEIARQQRAAEKSNDFQWGKAAALLGGSMIGGLDKLPSDLQTKVITGILQDSSGGQEGISNLTAVTNTPTNYSEPVRTNSNTVNAPGNTAAYKSTNSMQRIATDPNPYKNDFDWRDVGFAIATTRQDACQDAKAQANSEIARLQTVEVFTTEVSPCVCFDNFLAYKVIDDGTITCHVYIKTQSPKRSGPAKGVAR